MQIQEKSPPCPCHQQALRAAGLILGWTLACGLLGMPRSAAGGNFVCADEEIREAAEAARVRSAIFWTGAQLPGDWFRPCPISVNPSGSAWGRTRFRFARGEVFDWRMEVSGTRPALLNEIIPHEVDHMVRASLVRHPCERWLDEGCAALMESPASHARLRSVAGQADPSMIDRRWLQALEYPTDLDSVLQTYALGFSLVEFFLSRAPPSRLLAFQQDRGEIEPRLRKHYGLNIDSLRAEWQEWRQRNTVSTDCVTCGCQLHGGATAPLEIGSNGRDLPLLTIWSSTWCGPCRRFRNDFEQNAGFRAALLRRFRILIRDVDSDPHAARDRGIVSLPTFDVSGNRLTGYQNPEALLQQLLQALTNGGSQTAPAADDSPVPSTTPDSSEPSVPDLTGTVDVPENATTNPPILPGSASPLVDSLQPTTSRPRVSTPRTDQAPSPPADPPAIDWARLLSGAVRLAAWSGLIGGPLISGGTAGLAVGVLLWWLQRRKGGAAEQPVPFPRKLDEARQLLELRQSEGRVAALDALRGMFLEDELEKLTQTGQTEEARWAARLRDEIDQRVEEVAPLSTSAATPNH